MKIFEDKKSESHQHSKENLIVKQWRHQLWEFTRSRQGPENVCKVLGTKVKFEN